MTGTEITLLAIIAIMESRGDPNVPNGKADDVGIYQITPICVKDCQRLFPEKKYTKADRKNPKRAAEMCLDYTGHYYKRYAATTTRREIYIRLAIWNGGPQGPKIKNAQKYAERGLEFYDFLQIQKRMKKE
jgi:hypothetical protein